MPGDHQIRVRQPGADEVAALLVSVGGFLVPALLIGNRLIMAGALADAGPHGHRLAVICHSLSRYKHVGVAPPGIGAQLVLQVVLLDAYS